MNIIQVVMEMSVVVIVVVVVVVMVMVRDYSKLQVVLI